MRSAVFPWLENRLKTILTVSLIAIMMGVALLWATSAFDKEWLSVFIGGMIFIGVAVLSGRLERFLLGTILFMIPFNVDIQFRPIPIPVGAKTLSVSIIHLILAVLYPLWILRMLSERKSISHLWPAGASWLVFLIGWSSFSFLTARDPRLSVIMMVGLVQGFLTYFYIANHVRSREDLWFATRCLMAGLVLECLITLAQYVTGRTLGLDFLGERVELYTSIMGAEKVSRVVGTFGHSNALGAYLVAILPLSLVLNLTNLRPLKRWVIGGVFFFGLFTLVITLNRSGWISMTFTSLLFLGWLLIYQRKNVKPMPIILLALAGGGILAMFTPLIMSRWIESDAGAAASRLTLMKVAFSMIKSHPLIGAGLNNYTLVMHLYDQTAEGIAFRYPRPVHNAYFLLAAETGLVSLMALFLFIGKTIKQAWRRLTTTPDELTRFILLGLLLGLIGRMVDGFVQPRYLSGDLFLWIYPAILGVRHDLERKEKRSPESINE